MPKQREYVKPSVEVLHLASLSILESFSGEGEIDQFEDGGELEVTTFGKRSYSIDDDNIW